MKKNECMQFVAKKIFDLKKVQPSMESVLAEIGLDSIEFVELIVAIENEYGFDFYEEELDLEKYYYVQDLIDTIKSHIKETV